jgi:hypothetical protein
MSFLLALLEPVEKRHLLFELRVALSQSFFGFWGNQSGLEDSLDAEGQAEGFEGEFIRSGCIHVGSLLSSVF